MTEMMAQMTIMMQKTATAGVMPNPPVDQISECLKSWEYGDLLDRVAKFEKLNLSKSESYFDKPKKAKSSDAKKGETYSTSSLRSSKGKQVVYNVDKGKQPMQYGEKLKQIYNPNPQPKLILGENDKPRNFQGGGERPRQNTGTGDRTFPSLKDKMNKEYSFKRESVAKLFRQAVKAGLKLPECKRPEESKQINDPNYCPYHRVLYHPIEDCYIFKDWLERKYRKGELTLSDNVLSHPRKESTRVVTSSSVPPVDERKNDKKPVQEEQWETAISKKTTKMLKQLKGVPGMKWKSPTEPMLNLKGLPKVQTSISKQHLSQASSLNSAKVKSAKRKTKLKKPREKKTATQRVIDRLDEYYQTVRQPIKLAYFMSGLKIGETEEDGDTYFLPIKVCRIISVVPSTPINKKYVKKETPEACMMVLPMDCSSEEDLYFSEEDESDPDIASQMEHVNMDGDSESADESPDATMDDSEENVPLNESELEEIAQVQLRSDNILPPPPKKGVSDKDKGKEIVINEDIIPKDPKKDTSAKGINYNILSHLRKIPTQLNIYDALIMYLYKCPSLFDYVDLHRNPKKKERRKLCKSRKKSRIPVKSAPFTSSLRSLCKLGSHFLCRAPIRVIKNEGNAEALFSSSFLPPAASPQSQLPLPLPIRSQADPSSSEVPVTGSISHSGNSQTRPFILCFTNFDPSSQRLLCVVSTSITIRSSSLHLLKP
ncbi:hypothetical protein M5K25_018811 [Dendrobium thyrsiflorum]|uniref:Retrotransposon gag protein n=1 Tax=Dendrobium thyrsiflorum TaxID=117978 RepID=A0ABD0UDD2_DENTH